MAWSAASKIREWHEQQTKPNTDNNDTIRRLIGDAISGYSHGDERGKINENVMKALKALLNNPSKDQQIAIDNDLAQIESLILGRSIVDNDHQLDLLEEKNPKIKRLLHEGDGADANELGYKELLSISFDDVDFAVETVTDVNYKGNLKFNSAKLRSIITTSPAGVVSFTRSNNSAAKSTVIAWNNATEGSYKIND